MKKFKDLGIQAQENNQFTGEKIKMSKILNREITVHHFKIEPSKFNKGKCLFMQISLNKTKHVVFTGSNYLMDIISKIAEKDFPFTTTIVEDNERFNFT